MEANKNIEVRGRHFHCTLCDVKNMSSKAVQDHLKGKKHLRLLDLKNSRQRQAAKSIFVGGLNKLMSELVLTDYFMKFGDVSKVVIDKEKGQYAIVEFSDKESVVRATEQKKQTLQGTKVTVRPRESKPFAFHHQDSSAGGSRYQVQDNRYGTIPAELQKAILMRLSPAKNVSDQMKQLMSLLELPSSAVKLRYLICSLLQEVFQEFFPSCQVYPYGSSVNGFGIQGADLDLHLEMDATGFEYKFAKMESPASTTQEGEDTAMETNSEETKKPDKEEEKAKPDRDEETVNSDKDDMEIDVTTASTDDIMDLVCKVLRECVPSCKAVKPIYTARRPVVKFQHKQSRLYCDISMSNRLVLRNTELLSYYANLDERVRPLIYSIRHWSKVRQLAGNPRAGPRLTNYALSLMVVYYLQTASPPVLPTVDQLRDEKDKTPADIIEGWVCSFKDNKLKLTNTATTDELLRGFFHFYSTFDFTTNVISLKTGTALPISTFTPPESPVDKDQTFRLGPLNVQDPFELSHNVAFSVNEKIVQNFCKEVKKAYTLSLSLKFKKKPVDTGDMMTVWGLPVLFDSKSYVDAVPKRVRSGSTSTEGSVPEEAKDTYSIPIFMKASQLSDAFVKSHPTTESLRSDWCDATMALTKRILSEVLKVQCKEVSTDEEPPQTNESSLTEVAQMETDSSMNDAEEKNGTAPLHTSKTEVTTPLPDSSGTRVDEGTPSDAKNVSKVTEASRDDTVKSHATSKHSLDDDDGDLDMIAPKKKMKLDETIGQDDAGDNKACEQMDATSADAEIVVGQDGDGPCKAETKQLHLKCSISHQVWMGRRKVRRQLNQSQQQTSPSSSSSGDNQQLSFEEKLQMETSVSDQIIAEDSEGAAEALARFQVIIQEGDKSGQCCVDVEFQPLHGLAHFKNMFHFLQTFLILLTDRNTL